jgi:hypothetical protein
VSHDGYRCCAPGRAKTSPERRTFSSRRCGNRISGDVDVLRHATNERAQPNPRPQRLGSPQSQLRSTYVHNHATLTSSTRPRILSINMYIGSEFRRLHTPIALESREPMKPHRCVPVAPTNTQRKEKERSEKEKSKNEIPEETSAPPSSFHLRRVLVTTQRRARVGTVY